MIVISTHASHSDAFAAADRLTLATGRVHRARLGIECWECVVLTPAEVLSARHQWLMREIELLNDSAARFEAMAAATVPHRRPPLLERAQARRAAANRLLAEAAASGPVSTRGEAVRAEAS